MLRQDKRSIRWLTRARPPATPGSSDPTIGWASAVLANGGAVSQTQITYGKNLVTAWQSAGVYDLIDDFWLGRCENQIQMLTSFKKWKLGTAINSPTFTAHSGMSFDGVSQWANTNWSPGADGTRMTVNDHRMGVWETTEVTSNASSMGCGSGNNRNFILRARVSGNMPVGLNAAITNVALAPATSIGFSVATRSAGNLNFDTYKNGVYLGSGLSTVLGSSLATDLLALGCHTTNGTPSLFRANTIAFAELSRPLANAAAELAYYNALNSYMGVALDRSLPEPLEVAPGDVMVLLLTADQANQVTGPSPLTDSRALEPRPLAEGGFILPQSVLSDPAHSAAAEILAECPVVPAADFPELLADEDPA